MQTQKARNGSPDVPKKVSPRAARPLKITGLDVDSSSPVSITQRTPKDNKSPKILDRRSPRSPISEKKRPSRITELESQVVQLQDELKKAKDQLLLSDSSRKQAEKEAEDSKNQLLQVSSKIDATQNEIPKLFSDSKEDSSALETHGVSQESDETVALATAVHEIRQLKLQIEMVALSESGQVKQAELLNSEIQLLRGNLMETVFLVENFKNQLKDCEVSEAETEALTIETLKQLENAKKTVEALRSDGIKAIESYKKIALELEQSKSRMELLEELIDKLQRNSGDVEIHQILLKYGESRKLSESNDLEDEVSSLKCEVERLRAALEASEKKQREDNVEASSRLKIQAELQSELKIAKSEIEKLKARLMENERKSQILSEENENLRQELGKYQKKMDLEDEMKKLREKIETLKADLMDKENELQNISDENETLKLEVNKKDSDGQETMVKLGIAMEEADKSSKRAIRVTEQLEAAQVSNSEMESELRKLKVQSDQWRKAAEAATAMLSAENNGKFNENYHQTNSPYSEEIDDDLVRKKNANVLKKIGVLWKKPQK